MAPCDPFPVPKQLTKDMAGIAGLVSSWLPKQPNESLTCRLVMWRSQRAKHIAIKASDEPSRTQASGRYAISRKLSGPQGAIPRNSIPTAGRTN